MLEMSSHVPFAFRLLRTIRVVPSARRLMDFQGGFSTMTPIVYNSSSVKILSALPPYLWEPNLSLVYEYDTSKQRRYHTDAPVDTNEETSEISKIVTYQGRPRRNPVDSYRTNCRWIVLLYPKKLTAIYRVYTKEWCGFKSEQEI